MALSRLRPGFNSRIGKITTFAVLPRYTFFLVWTVIKTKGNGISKRPFPDEWEWFPLDVALKTVPYIPEPT
jgi:hypothetical protein